MNTETISHLEGRLIYLGDGRVEASYEVHIIDGGKVRSHGNRQLCRDEDEALDWLDERAIAENASVYTFDSVDEDGKPIKKLLHSICNSAARPSGLD
ncbi:hypothetical protein [Bradyrhizobium sp.]|uniref:hypothetical protein n=1 Tax=Bradyrhizobium sp. TaxID=376 RepID=UPI003C68192F